MQYVKNYVALHAELHALSLSLCRLKPLDIEFMKRLHEKVNVIPLIAKADTLTPEECQQFKKQVSSFHSCRKYIKLFFFFASVVTGCWQGMCIVKQTRINQTFFGVKDVGSPLCERFFVNDTNISLQQKLGNEKYVPFN